MAEIGGQRSGADRGATDAGAPRTRTLLSILRRVVAPRAPSVLVMERDGRLVCERVDERSLRSLG